MRILIAEDDFASRTLLDAVLAKWGYEVVAANDGEAAWEILGADNAPSVAIVDWMMPKLSGVELCRKIRGQKRELVPYVLMLTAKGQKSDISDGLDAGADDYVVKPFDLTELAARLRVARRSIEQQRELIDSRKAIQYQALHDISTGALNRGAALSALSAALTTATTPTTIALVALDEHKRLQQLEGAESAEAAVRGVVQRLRAAAPHATIGRYGAEELLVLLHDTALPAALEVVDAARRSIAAPAFATGLGLDGALSVSCGLAEWDGQAGLELLLCYADTALFAARSVGNAIDVFSMTVANAG